MWIEYLCGQCVCIYNQTLYIFWRSCLEIKASTWKSGGTWLKFYWCVLTNNILRVKQHVDHVEKWSIKQSIRPVCFWQHCCKDAQHNRGAASSHLNCLHWKQVKTNLTVKTIWLRVFWCIDEWVCFSVNCVRTVVCVCGGVSWKVKPLRGSSVEVISAIAALLFR